MKTFSALIFALVNIFAASQAYAVDNFHANCEAMKTGFAIREASTSYKNWRGFDVSAKPKFSLSRCVSDADRINVQVQSTSNSNLTFTFYGYGDPAQGLQFVWQDESCERPAADKYITDIRAAGTLLSASNEIDIRANYGTVACPAIRNALIPMLNQVNAEIVAAASIGE